MTLNSKHKDAINHATVISTVNLPKYLHISTNASNWFYIHTYTRITALFSGTTRVSQYQKGKTNLDFTEARDSEWQWHQLGHMQVCISLQTDNYASTPPLTFFTGRMPFLPPNQQVKALKAQMSENIKANILPHSHIYFSDKTLVLNQTSV